MSEISESNKSELSTMETFSPEDLLKQFCYYFWRALEEKIVLYLDILEGRQNSNISTSSLPGKAISGAAGAIPFVGKAASITSQEADKFILSKLAKKDSKVLSNFVYSYRNEKDLIQKIAVEAALAIFVAYEAQFVAVTTDGGKQRAMQKLAIDAAHRITTYFLEVSSGEEITKEVLIKAVLNGISNGNVLNLNKVGRTVRVDEKELVLKTAKIFTKVGVCLFDDENKLSYFKRIGNNVEKYGCRLKFSFEDEETIRELWDKVDGDTNNYKYSLIHKDFNVLYESCWNYILTQYPLDEAKAEREKYNEEANNDRDEKHNESMDDRQIKHEQASEERQELHEKTVTIVQETASNIIEETKSEIGKVVETHEIGLQSTLEVVKELHEETNVLVKENNEELKIHLVDIKGDIVETKTEISETEKKLEEHTQNLINTVNEIREQIREDNDVIVKINKQSFKNHPDVKNVRREVRNVQKEIDNLGDSLASAEKKVKNFFKW